MSLLRRERGDSICDLKDSTGHELLECRQGQNVLGKINALNPDILGVCSSGCSPPLLQATPKN